MKAYRRLKNAYKAGGIKEICRKGFFKYIYIKNGRKIGKQVQEREPEIGVSCNEREVQVVVSLTTYPVRFESIEMCLKSLVIQTYKPNHIIVYLGSDSIGIEIPKSVRMYEKYGVEFKCVYSENLRSHKKYYYVMQEYPEAIVVTADDDIIYPIDWLESLMDSYRKFPNAISARRVHYIEYENDGKIKKYNHWIDQYRKCKYPSNRLIAIGNGGILYPPHCLDDRVFDKSVFTTICFEADDIWLKCMAVLKGTRVVWVKNYCVDLPEVVNCKGVSLSDENVWGEENRNDKLLRNVMDYYHLPEELFLD